MKSSFMRWKENLFQKVQVQKVQACEKPLSTGDRHACLSTESPAQNKNDKKTVRKQDLQKHDPVKRKAYIKSQGND